jgi:hypothetical protein
MVVITGSPRSGTSLVMQTLQLLGFPIAGEKFNWLNLEEFNPKGFWELQPEEVIAGVKSDKYKGVGVKLFAQGLMKTEEQYIDKLIYCKRDLKESAKSFVRLLEKTPLPIKATIENAEQICEYNDKIAKVYVSVCKKGVLEVSYKRMVTSPEKVVREIADFLGSNPSEDQISAAIANVDRRV